MKPRKPTQAELEEFKKYLNKCNNTKPFFDKCKRISNKDYFYSLPKKLITNYRFDLMKYKAISRRIDDVVEIFS